MIALFIGRFQPLHKGHLAVINRLAKRFDLVKIGIGSSQFSHTKDNPLSGKERLRMLKKTLKGNFRFYLIQDINDDDKWIPHLKKIVGDYDYAYSGNAFVISLFKKHKELIRWIREIQPYSSTLVRKTLQNNGTASKYVPEEVIPYLRIIRERLSKS